MKAIYHQMFHLKSWVVYWEMLNRLLIDVIKRFGYLVENEMRLRESKGFNGRAFKGFIFEEGGGRG